MAMGLSSGQMEKNTEETGRMAHDMAKAGMKDQMGKCTMASGDTALATAKERISIQIEKSMSDNGVMGNVTERAH